MSAITYPLAGRVATDGTDILQLYRRRVGAWLRSARIATGLTQHRLGELVGVHGAAVSGWERGRIGVPGERVRDLAIALQIAPQELAMVLLRHSNPWAYAALFGDEADPLLRAELAAIPERLSDLRLP